MEISIPVAYVSVRADAYTNTEYQNSFKYPTVAVTGWDDPRRYR
jgi:hypothetical protein